MPTLDELLGTPRARRQPETLDDILSSRRRPKREQPLALDDEQTDSILKKAGRVGLSGISAAGNILDIPGSVARDVASTVMGRPENPLDQLLPWNWATDENRVSGRELARRAGFAGKQDTWGNLAGGIALEIGLDPLTYLSGGTLALAKGTGRAAKAAGLAGDIAKVASTKLGRTIGPREARRLLTPSDLIKHADEAAIAAGRPQDALARFQKTGGTSVTEPLGGSLGVGLPFRPASGTINLPGGGAVERAVDTAGRLIADSPLGVMAKGLFSKRAGNQFNRAGQKLAAELDDMKHPAEHFARENVARGAELETDAFHVFEKQYNTVISGGGKGPPGAPPFGPVPPGSIPPTGPIGPSPARRPHPLPDAGNMFDRLVTLTADLGGNLDQALVELKLPKALKTPALESKIAAINAHRKASNYDINTSNNDMGLKGGVLDEFGEDASSYGFAHNPRFSKGRADSFFGSLRNLVTKVGSMFGRNETIKYIPKEIANKITTDAAARGPKGADHILNTYGGYLGQELVEQTDPLTGVVTRVQKWTPEEHAKKLAAWAKGREQFPVFTGTGGEDYLKYQREMHLANAVGQATHDLVAKSLTPGVDTGISLLDVYSRADMVPEKAIDWLSRKTGKSIDDLKMMTIPEDVANTIIAVRKAQTNPEWLGAIGKVVDQVNKIFTRNVTIPFPSYISRNLTGGQFVNMVSGFVDNPVEYAKYVGKAWRAWRTGDQAVLKDLFINNVVNNKFVSEGVQSSLGGGLTYIDNPLNVLQTNRQVSKAVAENPLMQSVQYSPGHVNPTAGPIDPTTGLPTADFDPTAGLTRNPPFPAKTGQVPQHPTLNKLADPFRKGYGTWMKTGEKASALVEYMNRAPMYLYLTEEKGWDAATAAKKVGELQVDYDSLSQFEKQVMRRLVPFYTWSRRISPELLKTLGRRPGGALAQTIRATRNMSGADAATPEEIASNTSIPIATLPDGSDRYLTGLGLPHEQPLSYFGNPWNIGKTVRRAGLEGLSQLTPLVKGPLEWATNQSFFQGGPSGGTPLEDLDPTLGRLASNVKELATGEKTRRAKPLGGALSEAVVANLPLSRFTTTARQLSDPRKGVIAKALPFFSGIRITDVSPARKDAIKREAVTDLMREMGGSEFVRPYFPKEQKARMTPAQLQSVLELESLMRTIDKSMKDRAKRTAS